MTITNILTLYVTAYISTGNPCANGQYPTVNHTVAIPRIYPLNSKVEIDGKWYVGEDRLNKRFTNRVDMFVNNRAIAIKWGKQQKQVTIVYDNKSN